MNGVYSNCEILARSSTSISQPFRNGAHFSPGLISGHFTSESSYDVQNADSTLLLRLKSTERSGKTAPQWRPEFCASWYLEILWHHSDDCEWFGAFCITF